MTRTHPQLATAPRIRNELAVLKAFRTVRQAERVGRAFARVGAPHVEVLTVLGASFDGCLSVRAITAVLGTPSVGDHVRACQTRGLVTTTASRRSPFDGEPDTIVALTDNGRRLYRQIIDLVKDPDL